MTTAPRIRKAPPADAGLPIDLKKARASFEATARESILAAAAAILRDEGPAALTVRRVAEAVNTSTKSIYTLFGGKDGLLDALYLHSFLGLKAAMASVTGGSPAARLLAMCGAYRQYGLEHPALYNIMFGDLGRAYEAPPTSRTEAWGSFRVLRTALEDCLPSRAKDESGRITRLLWATMHGVVSLELRGLFGDPAHVDRMYWEAVEALLERTAGIAQNHPRSVLS